MNACSSSAGTNTLLFSILRKYPKKFNKLKIYKQFLNKKSTLNWAQFIIRLLVT